MSQLSHMNREKCIAMHIATNRIFKFTLTLYSSDLLMKLLAIVES